MPRVAKGCVEQLPSGSWRARVYAGIDPITKREIRLKATAKTEQQAHIELSRLLKEASEGRTPESAATVAKLLDEYPAIAPWDVSTRQTNEGFIRRTIKPALGPMPVRKVRGPILDTLSRVRSQLGGDPAGRATVPVVWMGVVEGEQNGLLGPGRPGRLRLGCCGERGLNKPTAGRATTVTQIGFMIRYEDRPLPPS